MPNPDEVAQAIERLYGERLEDEVGVLHVASAWRDETGRLFALRIGPDTPSSATDGFALALARARCDAILSTGKILRDEPGLRHRPDPVDPQGLTAWR